MSAEFDIQINAKDLYRFNMRQAYTSSQGPISIVIAILTFVMAGVTFSKGSIGYGILYVGIGILFLAYIPVTLLTRSKSTMKKNAVLSGVLHYHVSDEGIAVSQGEEQGLLEWNMIYKLITTNRYVLIYSNRVSAYIIPREQVAEQYEAFSEIAHKNLESYRIRMQ